MPGRRGQTPVVALVVAVLCAGAAVLVVDALVDGEPDRDSVIPGDLIPDDAVPGSELAVEPDPPADWLELEPHELLVRRAKVRFPDGEPLSVRTRAVGTMDFPSGKLVIFEPGWVGFEDLASDWVYVSGVGTRGRVVLNRMKTDHGTRVAAAALVFGKIGKVTEWRRADQRLPVDAGMGGFVDADDLDTVIEAFDPDAPAYYDEVAEDVIRVGFAEAEGPSYAVDSGMGDGAYEVWIGRSRNGAVQVVVVDFELLHHAESIEPRSRKPHP